MNNITEKYAEVKAARNEVERLRGEREAIEIDLAAAIQEAKDKWNAEHSEFLAIWEDCKGLADDAEATLREMVVTEYLASEKTDKQIAPGCSVRVNTKLRYDAGAALDFAKTHGICLKLDAKEFEKVAPTICPQLVETEETVTAVISFKE